MEHVIRFFVLSQTVDQGDNCVTTNRIEAAKPRKQTKHAPMTHYIDGFVIPLPKNKIDDYRSIVQKAGEVWLDHGALEYRECVGEDLDVTSQVPFPGLINSTPDETVGLAG